MYQTDMEHVLLVDQSDMGLVLLVDQTAYYICSEYIIPVILCAVDYTIYCVLSLTGETAFRERADTTIRWWYCPSLI